MSQAENQKPEDVSFDSIGDAVRFLGELGFKISQPSLYRHVKEGRLSRPFSIRSLRLYAAEHLARRSGPPAAPIQAASQERTRFESDSRKAAAQAIYWETRAQLLRGALVEREALETALARRALFLRSSLENWFSRTIGEFIALVNGDPLKAPDGIDFWRDHFEQTLAGYIADHSIDLPDRPDLERLENALDEKSNITQPQEEDAG